LDFQIYAPKLRATNVKHQVFKKEEMGKHKKWENIKWENIKGRAAASPLLDCLASCDCVIL
jgi:hypothetical protein